MNPREAAIQETEKLKQEVNLIGFAAGFAGYKIDSEKTSTRQVEREKHVLMRKDNGEKIIISRNQNGHWIFFNPENSFDKGTIFDFLEKRMPDFNMKRAKETIYACSKVNKDLINAYGTTDFSPITKKEFSSILLEFAKNLTRIEQSNFIERRGINQDEFFRGLVKDRLFSETFKTASGASFTNTVFPLYTLKEGIFSVCGFDRRNDTFKGFVEDSNREAGIWETLPKKDAPIGAYVISESPLDSLSYAELTPALRNANPVLAAYDGTITDAQIHLFSKRLDMLQPEKILICNDDDNAGEFFSAKILSNLNASKYAEDDYVEKHPMLVSAKIECFRAHSQGIVKWQFSHEFIKDVTGHDKNEQLILAFKTVEDYYSLKNRDLIEVNRDKEVFHIEKKFNPLNSEITISFPNNKYNWREVNDSFLDLRYNFPERLEIKRPLHKDFNEDLMVSKGLKKVTEEKIGKDYSIKL